MLPCAQDLTRPTSTVHHASAENRHLHTCILRFRIINGDGCKLVFFMLKPEAISPSQTSNNQDFQFGLISCWAFGCYCVGRVCNRSFSFISKSMAELFMTKLNKSIH